MTLTMLGRGAARRAVASVALLAQFVSPTPIRAQLDTPTSPLPIFEMADRQDWVLRATLADGNIVTGRVRDIDGASVRLEGGRFDVTDVESVDRARRTGGGGERGFGVGGVVLVIGVLLIALSGLPATSPGDMSGLGAVILALIGLGAVVGGLIGAAANPSETEWIPVWPAASEP